MSEKYSTRLTGFPPIEDSRIRMLVLGSFPSVVSLDESFYYAHPRNQFWKILSECWNEPVPESVSGKKKWVLSHHLGIWDVFASCEREGSLDQKLRSGKVNDLEGFIQKHPSLERLLLNGSLAASVYRKTARAWPEETGITVFTLPSTSPVPSKNFRKIDDKIPRWKGALDLPA